MERVPKGGTCPPTVSSPSRCHLFLFPSLPSRCSAAGTAQVHTHYSTRLAASAPPPTRRRKRGAMSSLACRVVHAQPSHRTVRWRLCSLLLGSPAACLQGPCGQAVLSRRLAARLLPWLPARQTPRAPERGGREGRIGVSTLARDTRRGVCVAATGAVYAFLPFSFCEQRPRGGGGRHSASLPKENKTTRSEGQGEERVHAPSFHQTTAPPTRSARGAAACLYTTPSRQAHEQRWELPAHDGWREGLSRAARQAAKGPFSCGVLNLFLARC